VNRLPAEQHSRTLRKFIQQWATHDLPAAAQWLGRQTAHWKADVVEALMKAIEPMDPAAALAWQASLSQS